MMRLTREQLACLTPHGDVNNLLADLTDGLAAILGGDLIGLYLTGSLTYGDFESGSSDIDFLAVLDRPLQLRERDRISLLHDRIAARFPVWAERIEVSYITTGMLESIEPPSAPRPYLNGGAFWDPDPQYGNEWLINLYALREYGVALAGPNPTSLIPPVGIEDVREASRRDLVEEWLPKLDQPEFLANSHHQAYVSLTLCRILHRAEHDGVVSKRIAAQWVRETFREPWVVDLIERAEQWQHGEELNAAVDVRRFIEFTRDRIAVGDD